MKLKLRIGKGHSIAISFKQKRKKLVFGVALWRE